ncbi:hypothetical protein E2C01_078165 [Portunus trituberculatus]|uniref:Uncharacterized protein n=1 Tax=Portunus trituberculatus TaxID=210409 RepID=A0A5B7ITE4_PORTR|nr:hypothetical protein [Portunus trituberculatus]
MWLPYLTSTFRHSLDRSFETKPDGTGFNTNGTMTAVYSIVKPHKSQLCFTLARLHPLPGLPTPL